MTRIFVNVGIIFNFLAVLGSLLFQIQSSLQFGAHVPWSLQNWIALAFSLILFRWIKFDIRILRIETAIIQFKFAGTKFLYESLHCTIITLLLTIISISAIEVAWFSYLLVSRGFYNCGMQDYGEKIFSITPDFFNIKRSHSLSSIDLSKLNREALVKKVELVSNIYGSHSIQLAKIELLRGHFLQNCGENHEARKAFQHALEIFKSFSQLNPPDEFDHQMLKQHLKSGVLPVLPEYDSSKISELRRLNNNLNFANPAYQYWLTIKSNDRSFLLLVILLLYWLRKRVVLPVKILFWKKLYSQKSFIEQLELLDKLSKSALVLGKKDESNSYSYALITLRETERK